MSSPKAKKLNQMSCELSLCYYSLILISVINYLSLHDIAHSMDVYTSLAGNVVT